MKGQVNTTCRAQAVCSGGTGRRKTDLSLCIYICKKIDLGKKLLLILCAVQPRCRFLKKSVIQKYELEHLTWIISCKSICKCPTARPQGQHLKDSTAIIKAGLHHPSWVCTSTAPPFTPLPSWGTYCHHCTNNNSVL